VAEKVDERRLVVFREPPRRVTPAASARCRPLHCVVMASVTNARSPSMPSRPLLFIKNSCVGSAGVSEPFTSTTYTDRQWG